MKRCGWKSQYYVRSGDEGKKWREQQENKERKRKQKRKGKEGKEINAKKMEIEEKNKGG